MLNVIHDRFNSNFQLNFSCQNLQNDLIKIPWSLSFRSGRKTFLINGCHTNQTTFFHLGKWHGKGMTVDLLAFVANEKKLKVVPADEVIGFICIQLLFFAHSFKASLLITPSHVFKLRSSCEGAEIHTPFATAISKIAFIFT